MWCSTSIQDAVVVAIAGAANVTRDVRGRELLETTNGGVFAANQESSGAGDVDMWKRRCGDATNLHKSRRRTHHQLHLTLAADKLQLTGALPSPSPSPLLKCRRVIIPHGLGMGMGMVWVWLWVWLRIQL